MSNQQQPQHQEEELTKITTTPTSSTIPVFAVAGVDDDDDGGRGKTATKQDRRQVTSRRADETEEKLQAKLKEHGMASSTTSTTFASKPIVVIDIKSTPTDKSKNDNDKDAKKTKQGKMMLETTNAAKRLPSDGDVEMQPPGGHHPDRNNHVSVDPIMVVSEHQDDQHRRRGGGDEDDDDHVTPGAVRVRGFAHAESSTSDLEAAMTATNADAPPAVDENPAVMVEIVTDEELQHRIGQELMQDIVEAADVHAITTVVDENDDDQKNDDVTKGIAHKKSRYLATIGAILILAAIAVIIIVVVFVVNRQSNNDDDMSSQRLQKFQDLLMSQSVMSDEATYLSQQQSAQYRALQWIANVDSAAIVPDRKSLDLFEERYTLATLYFATRGTNWTNQYNFFPVSTFAVGTTARVKATVVFSAMPTIKRND